MYLCPYQPEKIQCNFAEWILKEHSRKSFIRRIHWNEIKEKEDDEICMWGSKVIPLRIYDDGTYIQHNKHNKFHSLSLSFAHTHTHTHTHDLLSTLCWWCGNFSNAQSV